MKVADIIWPDTIRGWSYIEKPKPRYIYVSGPYTTGDPVVNVHNAINAADRLMNCGYIPYLPHLTMFWHLCCPHEYDEWLKLDLAWIEKCDALVRLPGESKGAHQEVTHAKKLGIPVYFGIESFLAEKPGEVAL